MNLNIARATIGLLGCLAAMLSLGCAPAMSVGHPPVNITEYELACDNAATSYPACTILLHNLQRTLNPNLAQDARLSSFYLVEELGEGSQEVLTCLAFVPDDDSAPAELRRRVTQYLLAQHEEVLAGMSPGSSVEPGTSR